MLRRTAFATLASITLAVASFSANADILFTNLGTAAPPATLGGHTMTPFDQAAQAALPEGYTGTVIPGNPNPGVLTMNPSFYKYSILESTNTSWAHGYTGPIFLSLTSNLVTLTLPPNTKAVYFYLQANVHGNSTFYATTDSHTESGPVVVATNPKGQADGATGFGFYSTAGESISSITVNVDASGVSIMFGEFGINGESAPTTTCASEGYKGMQLLWCKNICEKGYTGQKLQTWLHRWFNQYHSTPFCMMEGDEGGEGGEGGEGPQD